MANLDTIFHHIVLPPTLPCSRDADPFAVGNALLERLVQACGTLRGVTAPNLYSISCNELVTALGLCSKVYGKHVDKKHYHSALQSVLASDRQVLALHIVEQNAALLIYCRDEHVVFEAFEASPQSQNVLATPNALLWKFPSQAAQMPKTNLTQDENLQLALASFLSKATSEHLSQFAALGEKAGISVRESRNPGSPALITHMLLSIIETLGSPAKVHILKKRVRDDVQFRSGSGGTDPKHGPWRRHPFWLILRVVVRRHLQLAFGVAAGHVSYKILLSMVTANLLRDTISRRGEVTTVDLLLKKLCHRLAKIEKLPKTDGAPWSLDIPGIRALFEQTVRIASEHIQSEFNTFKEDRLRRIPRLPPRLDENHESLRLRLPNSLGFLQELSQRYSQTQLPDSNWKPIDLDGKLQENPGVLHARGTYNKISSLLSQLGDATRSRSLVVSMYDRGGETPSRACLDMSDIIDGLIKSLPPLSSYDPELNSQVCLTLFGLWMNLDDLATKSFPMLLDYRPPFPPDVLNVLQLSRLDDMEKARYIQVHLRARRQNAKFHDRTIFGTLDQRCFGTRFTKSSPILMGCLHEIREIEQEQKDKKRIEWEAACETYNQLSSEIESLPCLCTIDENGERDKKGCQHCFKKRERWRLRIAVCEDLLPKDDSLAAAIVFEINVPAALSAYRNTTWALLRKLAYPVCPATSGKTKKLADNNDLKVVCPTGSAFTNQKPTSVCLASSKKAFAQTHYQDLQMWAEYEELLVPHGSSYALYDNEARTWVSNFDRDVTLAHLCGISIPSPLAHVFPRPAHPPTHPDGPSSYRAVANRLQCPGDMAQHEFEAYHYLLAGRARRWLTLLAELGSSNLNFGKDDTLLTCTHLAHEVGPEDVSISRDEFGGHKWILGTCHAVFADDCFVDRLLGEIQKKLDATRGSWRETNSMDLIITLALAVYVRATNTDHRQKAQVLVRSVRTIVLKWVESLREEGETSAAASSSASTYSFRAALLGRRTFALLAVSDDSSDLDNSYGSSDVDDAASRHGLMGPQDVTDYLKLSIVLQQNRVIDMEKLSRMDKIMLGRDAALTAKLHDLILEATIQHPEAVGEAVAYGIGIGTGIIESFVPEKVYQGRHSGWMTAVISTASGLQQVDLDCLEGHILVDGKTIRKLPDDIRDSEEVQELFGQKHLLTYPSHITGAVCRLAAPVEGFSVHFGRHNGKPVIMAEGKNRSLSYFVPRRIFMDKAKEEYDLPRGLVDDCVHWYDRDTGAVEISRKPDIWRSKEGNWRLHVAKQQAWRRDSLLVDPHAWTCKTVATIFRNFEDARRLTVFQSIKVNDHGKTPTLKIELRHLDLSFSVNERGSLRCRELGAEIDPNQDAGTLYGYDSMIVMRELGDPGRRSIIAPLGPLLWQRRGCHVSVQTNIGLYRRAKYTISAQDKAYVRFTIDPVLGRLVCPPEPHLLYTKAQLHAFTSFSPLPDPLTGRTGAEEATATLLSGLCQPWEPLTDKSTLVLKQIRRLCPKRTFYPSHKRVLQQVFWEPELPTGIQHDRYGRLVDQILGQSEALKPFCGGGQEQEAPDGSAGTSANKTMDDGTAQMHVRAECQRLRFEAPLAHKGIVQDCQNFDFKYKSLGRSARFDVARVREVGRMFYSDDAVSAMEDLSVILERWNRIGGHDALRGSIDEMSLAELMSVDTMSERWGSLVRLCTEAQPPGQTGDIMMALAAMAFSPAMDMDAIRWLAAFFSISNLKNVQFPPVDVFFRFEFKEVPTQEYVEALVAQAYPPFVYAKPTELWNYAKLDAAEEREKHWAVCRQEGAVLARKIILQWPDNLEQIDQLPTSSKLLDMDLVLDKVRPEWQRLQRNWQLSHYVAEVQEIVQMEGLFGRCMPVLEQPERSRVARERDEYDGCLGQQEKAPCNVAPRLAEEAAKRDMQRTPLLIGAGPLEVKTGGESATLTTSTSSTVPYKPEKAVLDLGHLIGQFLRYSKQTGNELRIHYSNNLEKSLRALKGLQIQQRQQLHGQTQVVKTFPSLDQATQQERKAGQTVLNLYQSICRSFTESDVGSWLQQAGLWPRLTPTTLLELLRSTAPPASWGHHARETLVKYGCALTAQQQHGRIRRAISKNDNRRASEELQNRGHTNWRPIEHVDWLLLEIDSDMLIRARQVDVARALLAPVSQANAVLQLNMGQGKTSCIVPMAMAALADGHQLARLIVPKALLPPTAQMVQSRLGGLVGRQVRHLAFSRRLLGRPDIDKVLSMYEDHHNDLLQQRGILLAAPEHLLAFKLCGLQCLADCQVKSQGETEQPNKHKGRGRAAQQQRLGLAQRMLALQDRLASDICRDVLDESDVILAARTQLVYPSGAQTAVDGAPQRWKLAQVLLAVVEDQLPDLCRLFPQSINSAPRGAEEDGGRGFPMVQILQMDHIQEPLHAGVIASLSREQAASFGAWAPGSAGIAATKKQQILLDALEKDATTATIEAAAGLFADTRTARDGLLLVHGLLSHRILLICLRKRWNVQYGLHPKRWPIAVPYEAKGVPSDRSEFGHPDVAILLTCLAFYYAGLTREQFRDGLRHILCHHDDPVTAYAHWTAGGAASLPVDLQQWNVVNPDDESQVERLWSRLRLTRPVVDHYLNTFVFPAHARQFSVKLQASAWDVPLGKRRNMRHGGSKARTTGFSGTNDNRSILPLTIQQLDLDPLIHTNAEVLTYLLQDRNREYQCCMDLTHSGAHRMGATVQRRWTEDKLLQDLKKRHIRVLIDAGAYVLERDNKSLARAWLKIDSDAEAAIFFGESDNRAWVLFRDATAGCLPLVATPFVDERRLEKCLVYFDEAHTRGVDLLLPPCCRGGITLSLGQTKDHTIQAAMRLRQLGTTQSVIWYAPPEVDRSIRDVWHTVTGRPLPHKDPKLQSLHVLLWLLEQTCAVNEQLHPLYLSQGYDFCQRSAAEKRYRQYTILEDYSTEIDPEVTKDGNGSGIEYYWDHETVESNDKVRKHLFDTLQQPERMTLDQLYGSSEKDENGREGVTLAPLVQTPRPAPSRSGLAKVYQQLLEKGFDRSRSKISKLTTAAFEEVEQEREVQVQVEQVRAQKTKVKFAALSFPGHLHWAIESFLGSDGILPSRHGFRQAFASMARSEVGRRYEVSAVGAASALYVSVEFERTIQPNSGVKMMVGKTAAEGEKKKQNSAEPAPPAHDQFIRPVQWLLWSRCTKTALVVVPEEAELLLLRLRRQEPAAHIHLLLYSAAVTRAMVDLSSGTYYAVPSLPADYRFPSWLTIEAGILGGRLYMSFDECEVMRSFLKESSAVAQDNVVDDRDTAPSLFCPNISSFLLDWLLLRRAGQDISHTPAAYICQGRPLHQDHAFFVR